MHLPTCIWVTNLHLTALMAVCIWGKKYACNCNAGLCTSNDVKLVFPSHAPTFQIDIRFPMMETLLSKSTFNNRQIQKLRSTIKLDRTKVTSSSLRQNNGKLVTRNPPRMKHPRCHRIFLRPQNATYLRSINVRLKLISLHMTPHDSSLTSKRTWRCRQYFHFWKNVI